MSYLKRSLILFSVLLVAVGVVFISVWLAAAESISYAYLVTVLTITTETFGTLLGIITAGLMFTQGKFSELASEITGKLPRYLSDILSLKRIQTIETRLIALKKILAKLAETTTISKEKSLYERIVEKTSLVSVDLAVFSYFKLKQQGLDAGFLFSEMNSNLYKVFEKRKQKVKKEWHLFKIIQEIVDVWEAPATSIFEKYEGKTTLQADLKSSISILKLKEAVDKKSKDIRDEVAKSQGDLDKEISQISQRLKEDKISQLLSQMEYASVMRGRYFYLTLIFIAAPLLINILILPQFSEASVTLFRPIVSITCSLSVIGIMFLFLYIHKILNV